MLWETEPFWIHPETLDISYEEKEGYVLHPAFRQTEDGIKYRDIWQLIYLLPYGIPLPRYLVLRKELLEEKPDITREEFAEEMAQRIKKMYVDNDMSVPKYMEMFDNDKTDDTR